MKEFSMKAFENLLANKEGSTLQEAAYHHRLMTLFDVFLDLDVIDESVVQLFSDEDLEWLDDLIQFWPTYDTDEDDISMTHAGIEESVKFYWLYDMMNVQRSKRKERFI